MRLLKEPSSNIDKVRTDCEIKETFCPIHKRVSIHLH